MADRKSQEELQKQIDENLRRVFNDQIEQDLPERFTSLLAKLKSEGGSQAEADE